MKPIIIIGAGLAGYTVARELRKLDKAVPLLLVTADDGGFYSKPMLSNAFGLGKPVAQLVTQSAVQMAEQLNAHIITRTVVEHLDPEQHAVATSAGTFHYSQLVIAVGAQPIRLPIEGDAAHRVLSVNHVSDYVNFRSQLTLAAGSGKADVTILGAGLIGCEFADDLASAGHLVTLVDPNPAPLAALAAPTLSEGLHAALGTRGIAMKLGTTARRIDNHGRQLRVTLANGDVFDTGIVLSAVGLRPDLALARAARLASNRGIVVDVHGRTSAADVYAVGDCAEYTVPGDGTRTLPYIAPLMTAARAIARTLAGEPTAIDWKPAPVIVKTPSFPLAILPPPLASAASGYWQTELGERHTICRFYDDEGVLCGFGVAPQDAGVRQMLTAELGSRREATMPG